MGVEGAQEVGGKLFGRMIVLAADFVRVVRRQQGNIFLALSQRWYMNMVSVETVKQIVTEFSGIHHRSEVTICRCDDSEITADFPFRAEGPESSLLQDAEQGFLQVRAEFGYFIQEDGSVVGLSEKAVPGFVRAGEGAFGVPEQNAFGQVLSPLIYS